MLRREGLPIETESAPIGGAGYDAARHPLPGGDARARARARTPCCWARSAGRNTTRCRARCAPSRASSGFARRWRCSRTCARRCSIPSSPAASTLKPEVVAGLDLDDRPRADRRHLLRRAARPAQERRGRGRGLRHDALQRVRDRAHRAGRLRDRAPARQAALLGRQGQRARHQHPVARGRDGDARATIPTSRSRTCTSTTRRCSSCATRSSST